MTDTTHDCPPGLNLTSYIRRSCGNTFPIAGRCSSTILSVADYQYSQVCGRIRGYQVGGPSAFFAYVTRAKTPNASVPTIEDQYVGGVSLTPGPVGERQHIWTFAAGITKYRMQSFQDRQCPCDASDETIVSPPFVGNDYFCESGINAPWTSCLHQCGVPYLGDPLWDGDSCASSSTCCQLHNPPWFVKNLPNSTTDDIELRLCSIYNQDVADIPLDLIELYVK